MNQFEIPKTSKYFYIDGEWQEPTRNFTIPVVNPFNEEVIGTIPEGNAIDANKAVLAAKKAFTAWSKTAPSYRSDLLHAAHKALISRGEELSVLISKEVGTPIKISKAIQVSAPTSNLEYYANLAKTFKYEENIGTSLVIQEPVGVVACITPWNFPLHQIIAKVGAALAAGCTVILKPSEAAPYNAYVLAEAFDEAGLPPGVFNLVTGYGPIIGEALVKHPMVDGISFTGSTVAGRRISEAAAQGIKRVSLELGGKSASVVLRGADLSLAVKSTVNSCFLNSGQTCSALTRLIVSKEDYEQVVAFAIQTAEKFTLGDPLGGVAKLGPLISRAQQERVWNFISTGIDEGATLLFGGLEPLETNSKGFFVRPTIFGNVRSGSTLDQEEVFGPVLSILTYSTEEEALDIANGTKYGLAGAVWAKTDEEATRVAKRLRTGQVDINGAPFNPIAPFGGYKQSGHGREMGPHGLNEFLETKSIQYRQSPSQ
jgi:acyl-CoA reductase-like NAD-dependent aldehyde dehydrogenase